MKIAFAKRWLRNTIIAGCIIRRIISGVICRIIRGVIDGIIWKVVQKIVVRQIIQQVVQKIIRGVIITRIGRYFGAILKNTTAAKNQTHEQ